MKKILAALIASAFLFGAPALASTAKKPATGKPAIKTSAVSKSKTSSKTSKSSKSKTNKPASKITSKSKSAMKPKSK